MQHLVNKEFESCRLIERVYFSDIIKLKFPLPTQIHKALIIIRQMRSVKLRREIFSICIKCVFVCFSCVFPLFSQIQNGKYVFQNENVVIGYSVHLFKEMDLADAKAVTSVLIQEMLDRWAVNLTNEVIVYKNFGVLKQDIRKEKMDIIALTTPEYLILKKQVQLTPFLTFKILDRIMDRIEHRFRQEGRREFFRFFPFSAHFKRTQVRSFKAVAWKTSNPYRVLRKPFMSEPNYREPL
jgi:hypothetical protein